jgi:hypothetical protein
MESTTKRKATENTGKWLISLMATLLMLAIFFGAAITKIYIDGIDEYRTYWILKWLLHDVEPRTTWGPVGDFFGGILNPVFAFLGLIMLLATLYQSQKELSLTRKEFAKSVEALDDQAKTQRQQRFENTFFSLLEQHNKFADAVKATKYEIPWEKASVFSKEKNNLPEKLRTAFRKDVDGNYIEIKTYCTFLYQMLKFIYEKHEDKKDGCVTEEMKFYSNLIRASIDTNLGEIILINALCTSKDDPWGYRKFRDLITFFNFLEHVKIDFDEYDLLVAFEINDKQVMKNFEIKEHTVLAHKVKVKNLEDVDFNEWRVSRMNRFDFYNQIIGDNEEGKYYADAAYGAEQYDRHFYNRLKWQISQLPD